MLYCFYIIQKLGYFWMCYYAEMSRLGCARLFTSEVELIPTVMPELTSFFFVFLFFFNVGEASLHEN